MTALAVQPTRALTTLRGSLYTAPMRLSNAVEQKSKSVRENAVIPIIIVIAIVVLLLLAASIVAAAIILCAQRGGVLDGAVNLNNGYVRVSCHKI